MARRRRSKRTSRFNITEFRRLVRAAVSSPHISRVRSIDQAPTAAASPTSFILLNCDDDPDYDLASTGGMGTVGTNVAEVQPFSRITKIDLNVQVKAPANTLFEWIIYKDPDGALGEQVYSTLFTADVTQPISMLRKYAIAGGWTFMGTNMDLAKLRVRVRRKALQRAGLMHDGDQLKFVISNNADIAVLGIVGRITTSGR